MAACCTHHKPTYFSWLLNRAIQKKAYLLMKNKEEFPGKSSGEWAAGKKKRKKTERVTGLGRKTREEIVKWNQMTALRFQTGGRHQISLASLWGPERRQAS